MYACIHVCVYISVEERQGLKQRQKMIEKIDRANALNNSWGIWIKGNLGIFLKLLEII